MTQQTETDALEECRAAFEKYFKGYGLDFTQDKDAWDRPKYKHSHIDAMWQGWQARTPEAVKVERIEGLDTVLQYPLIKQYMYEGCIFKPIIEAARRYAAMADKGE